MSGENGKLVTGNLSALATCKKRTLRVTVELDNTSQIRSGYPRCRIHRDRIGSLQDSGRRCRESLLWRILLVEDHPDTAVSTATVLRLEGHEVEVVSDGKQALAAARASHPDAILLDIGLPGLDGWSVAQHLQQMEFEKRPTVIALTGYGQPQDKVNSKEAGIHVHLLKPVDPQALLTFLEQLQKARSE